MSIAYFRLLNIPQLPPHNSEHASFASFVGYSGVTVKMLPSRAVGPGSTPGLDIFRDLFLEPMQYVGAEWTLNCVSVPMSGLLLVRLW
jgi:hypothetical protein